MKKLKYGLLLTPTEAMAYDEQRDAALYARTAMDIARKLIEHLPAGYAPGQRSGPEERNAHAALVVALRLGAESSLFDGGDHA